MGISRTFTIALLASGTMLGAHQAMALSLGDGYVRVDVVRTHPLKNHETIKDTHSFSGAIGWQITKMFGVEFSTIVKKQNIGDDAHYRPYNLFAQWYMLGSTHSQVRPYAGIGVSYNRFSGTVAGEGEGDAAAAVNLKKGRWAPAIQLGVDYFITDWLALNGNVQYTNLKAKGDNGYSLKIDPLVVGAGVTFRF